MKLMINIKFLLVMKKETVKTVLTIVKYVATALLSALVGHEVF